MSWQAISAGFVIVAAIAVSFLHAMVAIAARWDALGAIVLIVPTYLLLALLVLTLVVALVYGAFSSASPVRLLFIVFVLCSLISCAVYVSTALPKSYRDAEIARALNAGLQSDCDLLFTQFRDDERFKEHGYIRLFPGSKEYDLLPDSIRTFDPLYVTIEDRPFGVGDLPPNIGLCKNGFGGFHMGLRVFLDDPGIPESTDRIPVTSRVYLWVDQT